MRAARLARDFEVAVRWRSFPLHPGIPEDGQDLAELFAGRGVDLDAVFARLKTFAAEVGLPLGDRRRTHNSRRAQELSLWAEEHDAGEAFRGAVFRGYFAEGRNIARIDVLAALAESAGLSDEEAKRVLREGTYAAAVDGEWERARVLGIRAVPTMLLKDRRIEGFRPYADLVDFVTKAGVYRRAGELGQNEGSPASA